MQSDKIKERKGDAELREDALSALQKMKEKEKEFNSKMATIKYPNGVVVKTNNKELIEFYNNKYGNKL